MMTTRMAPVGRRIAEEGQCDVTACKAFRHDARTDDGGDQERRAERLSGEAPTERLQWHQAAEEVLRSGRSMAPIS